MELLKQFDGWKFLAGLGIFLFGMYFLELALKNLAGRNFKKFLRIHTSNPVKGIIGGTLITALLQSSSVVSLMVLAFVGAGIIQLKNAIGIIFGSNLGTTFTGWLVGSLGFQVNIESFAFPLIATGGIFLMVFSKVEKLEDVSRFILGFGFLFLGLEYMKTSIGQFASVFDISVFEGWSPYLFFPIGFVLTAIIQSSSAAMVITLSSLNAGIIPLESGAAMVVGSDLGTTTTVIIGALSGSAAKKRVALSHFLFNLVTDLLALAIMFPLLNFITDNLKITDPIFVLVSFHSGFNFVGIVLMFPFIGWLAHFLENRFDKENDQIAKHIVKVSTKVPEAAIEALKKEILELIDRVFYLNIKGLNISSGLFSFHSRLKKEPDRFFRIDDYLDEYASLKQLEGEIVEYYLSIQNEKLVGSESNSITHYIQALRNAMIAAKQIKDIKHNIKEFETSSNDTKQSLYQFFKGKLNSFYLSLQQVYLAQNNAAYFEQIEDLMKENQVINESFLREIYHQIEKDTLAEIEISTLLNVNQEVFHANQCLLISIKDIQFNLINSTTSASSIKV